MYITTEMYNEGCINNNFFVFCENPSMVIKEDFFANSFTNLKIQLYVLQCF